MPTINRANFDIAYDYKLQNIQKNIAQHSALYLITKKKKSVLKPQNNI